MMNFKKNGKKEMHKVICSKCGKHCHVPFKPSNDKPLYCEDCFDKNDAKKERSNLDMHKTTCAACGDSCEVPFKPNDVKPVYCLNCFGKDRSSTKINMTGTKPKKSTMKLNEINEKLDRILELLEGGE